MINGTGWSPVYDARLNGNQLRLVQKANVYQTSGEDWDNVLLEISTGNPSLSGVKPKQYSWSLDFERPPAARASYKRSKPVTNARMELDIEAAGVEDDFFELNEVTTTSSVLEFVETGENIAQTSYSISKPYTIPSDGEAVTIIVDDISLDTKVTYGAVPKQDRDAFILANISGWEEHNLLDGKMNVYLDGSFIGNSWLNPSSSKDTIQISMGRTNGFTIERKKLKDLTAERKLGNKIKKSFGYEITVKNNLREVAEINIEDLVPTSRNKEIQVEVRELTGGVLERHTGFVMWNMKLSPRETKKVQLKFDISYPADKRLSGL